MLGYCPHCKANTPYVKGQGQVLKSSKGQPYFVGRCSRCKSKSMPRFLKKQDMHGNGLLSAIGIPIPQFLKDIPFLGNILF